MKSTEDYYEDEIYGLQCTVDNLKKSYLKVCKLAQLMRECISYPDPKCEGCQYLHGSRCEVIDLYHELIGDD